MPINSANVKYIFSVFVGGYRLTESNAGCYDYQDFCCLIFVFRTIRFFKSYAQE
jgi:hypothetical protein